MGSLLSEAGLREKDTTSDTPGGPRSKLGVRGREGEGGRESEGGRGRLKGRQRGEQGSKSGFSKKVAR
jgi:hypothetical protein